MYVFVLFSSALIIITEFRIGKYYFKYFAPLFSNRNSRLDIPASIIRRTQKTIIDRTRMSFGIHRPFAAESSAKTSWTNLFGDYSGRFHPQS